MVIFFSLLNREQPSYKRNTVADHSFLIPKRQKLLKQRTDFRSHIVAQYSTKDAEFIRWNVRDIHRAARIASFHSFSCFINYFYKLEQSWLRCYLPFAWNWSARLAAFGSFSDDLSGRGLQSFGVWLWQNAVWNSMIVRKQSYCTCVTLLLVIPFIPSDFWTFISM